MRSLRDLSIRYKLALLSLGISGLILLLATSAFVFNDYFSLRATLIRALGIQSRIVAFSADSALRFDDPLTAGETLAALRADDHVLAARIYTPDGKPVVTYYRRGEAENREYLALKDGLLTLLALQAFNFDETGKDLLGRFLETQDGQFLSEELRENMLAFAGRADLPLKPEQRAALRALLARYEREVPATGLPADAELNASPFDFQGARLRFWQPVLYKDEPQGMLLVVSDLGLLADRLRWFAAMVVGVLLGSVLLALLLSAYMQRLITRPIFGLLRTAEKVSAEKNFGLRAARENNDELGALVDGFNAMLGAIQARDQELARHRDELENLVAERTAELKKLNRQLTFQAFHDALTNLPNRAMFAQQVEQAIVYAKQQDQYMAMLFLDLDHFKYINDTLGHSAGDRILQEVAKRIVGCTRQPDDLVARLGGDEFTVLLRNIREAENAGTVAEKIIKSLALPFRYEGQDLYVTTSIGISAYPRDGHDVSTLMRNADTSMYLAKQQGRNTYQFYTAGADTVAINRLHMENKLRHALEFKEFEVWYQPRFELVSGHLDGAEALVRWRSPELNLVSPAQFIPLAEDTGLIVPIGEWVLRTACLDNQEWQQHQSRPVTVSVNFSARQFWQEDLLDRIGELIADLRFEPSHLELELTESLIMPNAEETIDTLRALKRLGIQISVDDFGTGYSSLSYLKRFPIDILKIDQSFIYDIGTDAEDMSLVTAIIAMAHKLKLKVVAEGVENRQQLDFLTLHQCDYAQGYLFGKPIPAKAFKTLLRRELTLENYPAAAEELFRQKEFAASLGAA